MTPPRPASPPKSPSGAPPGRLESRFSARIERLETDATGATISLRVVCHGTDTRTLEAIGRIPALQYRHRVRVALLDDADDAEDCACPGGSG